MIRAFDAIISEPWAIMPMWLNTISEIAQRYGNVEEALLNKAERINALDLMPGEYLEGTSNVKVSNGVAVVSAIGPIIRYGNVFSSISGAQSLQSLASDFKSANESQDVESILLYVDGPGGHASGINEFSDQVFKARDNKRIVAYVSGMAASAHYWFVSAADEIVIDPTTGLGCLGIVFGMLDETEKQEKDGVKQITIVSSNAPLKGAIPSSDEGVKEVLSHIDAIEGVFLNTVARNRGVSLDTVINDFGKGGILVGQAAVDAGLADRLGNFEDLFNSMAGVSGNNREAYMTDPKSVPDAETPAITVASIKTLYPDIASSFIAEGEASAKSAYGATFKQGCIDAAMYERKRIVAILDSAPVGFSKEADAAIESGATAEAFALATLKSAKDRGVSLADLQNDGEHVPPVPEGTDEKPADYWGEAAENINAGGTL